MRASLAINASLEPSLVELVKIRASQINGCANCLNMHTAEARAKGETEQRIYLLSAWREAPGLHRARRGGAGLDGRPDAALAGAHPRGRPCGAQRGVLRGGAGQAHPRDQRHQRLEPPGGRLRHPGSSSRRGTPRRDRRSGDSSGRGSEPSICCVPGSPASRTACSARSPMPRTWCRRRSSAGCGPAAARCASPKPSCGAP